MYLLRKVIELRISIVFILLICSFEVRASLRLVENGASRYTILIDKNAPTSVQDSVQELERFFYKKTGIHLRIVNDEEKVGQYFIGVGRLSINNNYLKTYSDGFVIKTKSNNIYIYGNDTKDGEVNEGGGRYTGTANGVYFFLREYLDVNVTNPDAIDKHVSVVSDVVIPKINVVEKSPFFYRELPYIGDDKAVKKWKKYMLLAKTYPIEHGHAWSSTIPPELYDTHPDWFAEVDAKNVRPIDSKYKLETTNPDLVNAYANEVIKVFEKEPNREWYSLSPSDGGGGWSNSKMANDLIEMDHYGHVSRTSLILHFYNDVAKIVHEKFPNKHLAGYVYASYLYPPSDDVPNVESNISLVIAPNFAYGFRLYRKDEREKWLYLLKSWSNYARRNGYDLYYYDLPTWVKFDVDIIRPVSVDIMNFIFFGLSKYKIKGLYIYGCSEWSVCGVNNYVLSKKIWNPDLDANSIVREYFYLAYGKVLYSYINRIYNIFDDAYKRYYVNNENASYKITRKHLIEIYSKNQIEIESILDVALVLAVAEGDASHIDNVKRLDSQIRRIRQILLARNIPIK